MESRITRIATVTNGEGAKGGLFCKVSDVAYTYDKPFIVTDTEYHDEYTHNGTELGFRKFFEYLLRHENVLESKELLVEYYGPYEVTSLACAPAHPRSAVDYIYGIPEWYVEYTDEGGECITEALYGAPFPYTFPGTEREDDAVKAAKDEGWEVVEDGAVRYTTLA